MAMSLEGGRGRARRGGGTRDLQWVDNKPQSSSRCVRATLCSPQLSLSHSFSEKLTDVVNQRLERFFSREFILVLEKD